MFYYIVHKKTRSVYWNTISNVQIIRVYNKMKNKDDYEIIALRSLGLNNIPNFAINNH